MTAPRHNFSSDYYQIKLKGRLCRGWEDWFEGMTMTYQDGITTLTGPVTDQSALHGLLIRVRDLGLYLISVNRIPPAPD